MSYNNKYELEFKMQTGSNYEKPEPKDIVGELDRLLKYSLSTGKREEMVELLCDMNYIEYIEFLENKIEELENNLKH